MQRISDRAYTTGNETGERARARKVRGRHVVDNPLERAIFKARRKDVYERLVADYAAWNGTMLPFDPKSSTDGFNAHQLADHFGVEPAGGGPAD
jgi:hypothetical protein